MNLTPLRILCIEDDANDAALIKAVLRKTDPVPQMQFVSDASAAFSAIATGDALDLVLSDYHIHGYTPVQMIDHLSQIGRDLPLIVVSNAVGEGAAMEVLRAGAADYVSKDRVATLPMVIARVLDIKARRQKEKALLADNQRAAERLRHLGADLVCAQERERRVIAQELHDNLGQMLTALLLHLQAADDAADPQEETQLRLTAQQILRQSIDQLRGLSFSMRPVQLDTQGLAATLHTLARQMLEPARIAFDLRLRGVEDALGGAQSAVAFRIAQEAFTNAVRHARPAALQVRLCFCPNGDLRMVIADDGRGFQVDGSQVPAGLGGRGLSGMAERCELAGGRLGLRSRIGQGTVLRVRLGPMRS